MKHYLKYFVMIAAAVMFAACGGDDNDEPQNPGNEENTETPGTPDWHLEWVDNFDLPQLDASVWHKCDRGTPDWCNNMSHDDACYGIDNGNLILRGIRTPEGALAPNGDPETWDCIVGGVETSGLKAFVPPFRIEIRCKMDGAKGAWPAIWMMPFAGKYGWPCDGEIDIVERLNHDNMVYQTVHMGDPDGNRKDQSSGTTATINGSDYNTYALMVTKSAVVWYVNGKETFRYTKNASLPEWRFPFNQAWHLKIDMQLGGSWVGEVDLSQLPIEMKVDYVKYYRYY